ncbi:MAG: GAF domain-containing protein [Chloroflexota bacterium]
MALNDPWVLGVVIAGSGLLFWAAAALILRWLLHPHTAATPAPENIPSLEDFGGQALLVIQPGGRLVWISSAARQIFGVKDGETPNLERLGRLTRPASALFNLCAQDGQARLIIEGKPVDGLSFLIPLKPAGLRVVSLRQPEAVSAIAASPDGALSAQTTQVFIELTQTMAASLDLEDTLFSILENLDRILPADFREITVYDADTRTFIPYRMQVQADGDRQLVIASERYPHGEGLSGALARERQPLLIADLDNAPELTPMIDRRKFPLRSFLGVPLMMGQELIGTLELASFTTDTFHPQDRDLLALISGQAAVAIHNALLYRQEQRRLAELNGLAQLTQAFSSVRDSKELFERLVNAIQSLVKVRILGFLLFNETTHTLEGQAPFAGIPDQFLEYYRIPVPPGSLLEKTLLDQDVLISDNAGEDDRWLELGLQPAAITAGLKDAVMMPLAVSGRVLGYLQAANHHEEGATFNQEELHLMMIVANQVAPIIDNAALVQQSRQRAQRAEGLRRIASLASSAATLDEMFKYSLQELAHLLQADLATAFLLDQNRVTLQLHRPSRYGESSEIPERLTRLLAEDAQFPFTAAGSQHTFRLNHSVEEKPVVPFYQQLIQSWKIESLIIVPLVVRDEGIGEVWIASRQPNFFDPGDVQLMATAAGQLAGVVERNYLLMQTDETLRRRVEQMTSLTRVTRELSTSLDLKYLLQLVYDEALRTTRADCGSILFFDLDQIYGDIPQIRFSVGDSPPAALSPLEQQVISSRMAYLLRDMQNPDYQLPHEGVQVALMVPIYHQDKPGGLIILHAVEADRFDESAMDIAQSLAAQATIALSNAVNYEEQTRRGTLLKRQLDTLGELFQVTNFLRPDQPLERALEAIAQAIVDATPFRAVLVSAYDSGARGLRRLAYKGLSPETWSEISSRVQPWRGVQQLLQEEYRIGGLYFIPADKQPLVPEDVHTLTILPTTAQEAENLWNADDFLLAPLYDPQGQPLGLISVDDPRDARRPDRPTLDALEIFAVQAALLLENHRYMDSLKSDLAAAQQDSHHLNEAAQSAREQVPMLLHRQVEQTVEIRRLYRQFERVRAGLDIAAYASQQRDTRAALISMGRALVEHFGWQTALVAEGSRQGARLIEVIGSLPVGANPEALFGQRNPLRQALVDGKLLLVNQVDGLAGWQNTPLLNGLAAQSFAVFPFEISSERRGAVLICGSQAAAPFDDEDYQIYDQLCRQVSVSLQNLELLAETRRRLGEVDLLLEFSRKLGTLDPLSILTTLLESTLQAIPAVDAGWVGLLDEGNYQLQPLAAQGYTNPADLIAIRYALERTPPPLPVQVVLSGQPLRARDIQFAQDYNLSAEDLIRYREATRGRLPVSALVTPIRLVERSMGVLVLESFDLAEGFSVDNENLALSLAQQTALALENARLFGSIEQRTSQLQALTQVSAMITSSLQSDALIASLLDQLQQVVPFDTATLWLRSADLIRVAEARGFEDEESRIGLTARVEDSALFQEMSRTALAISVPDVRGDDRFTTLLVPEYLSWLGIPLVAKAELIGVIALEKRDANFYRDDFIQAAMTFAGQAAVALDNARLFEESQRRAGELDQRSSRLALLNRFSSDLGVSLDVRHILNLTCERLSGALDVARVAAALLHEDDEIIVVSENPPAEGHLPLRLPSTPIVEQVRETQGVFNTENIEQESGLEGWKPYLTSRGVRALVIIPMVTGQDLQGWLLLQSEQARRFSAQEIELARTISNQAIIALQNARRFEEIRQLKEALEQRVEERTAALSREHRKSQTMLKVTTELSASLDIQQVLTRSLSVLNEAMEVEESLILRDAGRLVVRAGGKPLESTSAESENSLERQIHRWLMRVKKPAMIADVHQDSRWQMDTDNPPAYHSIAAIPLILGEESLGSLFLLKQQRDYFNEEQLHVLEGVARQIAITLNNAELFTLIRDQAENLGGMLRDQQIEASRSRGILEAVADGVIVTAPDQRITLFNQSAEALLAISTGQVVGQPLERLAAAFEGTGSGWMLTIQRWSARGILPAGGESYAEQITLQNGRVLAIHLAPVVWRSEFLGTVSIVRDITHLVQVDRLKSEFIANVSHELRTPLTSIKGYTDILLMGAGGELTEKQVHFINILRENAERLTVLVNDLLDVSRMQSGKVMLEAQRLDAIQLAREVIEEMHQRSKESQKPMTFNLEAPEDLPAARGDRERTLQVLSSLVTNAFNFTPENGRVVIRLSAQEQVLQIDVIDNGIGIPLKDHERIFDRFYRGENPLVMATPGTGLGLALSKILVEMQEGRIWFTSTGVPGDGSTFSFTLPRYPPEG